VALRFDADGRVAGWEPSREVRSGTLRISEVDATFELALFDFAYLVEIGALGLFGPRARWLSYVMGEPVTALTWPG
jgi:hypothetical protein